MSNFAVQVPSDFYGSGLAPACFIFNPQTENRTSFKPDGLGADAGPMGAKPKNAINARIPGDFVIYIRFRRGFLCKFRLFVRAAEASAPAAAAGFFHSPVSVRPLSYRYKGIAVG